MDRAAKAISAGASAMTPMQQAAKKIILILLAAACALGSSARCVP
jgi:hypothetical protein